MFLRFSIYSERSFYIIDFFFSSGLVLKITWAFKTVSRDKCCVFQKLMQVTK